jgi:hypothetical protein
VLCAGLTVPTTKHPHRRHAGWHGAGPEVQEGRRERSKNI